MNKDNLTLPCPQCFNSSHNPDDECDCFEICKTCNLCKGTGSVPVKILSAEDIIKKEILIRNTKSLEETDDFLETKFIKLSDAQKLIEAKEQEMLLIKGKATKDSLILIKESYEKIYSQKYEESVLCNTYEKVILLIIHKIQEAERNKVSDENKEAILFFKHLQEHPEVKNASVSAGIPMCKICGLDSRDLLSNKDLSVSFKSSTLICYNQGCDKERLSTNVYCKDCSKRLEIEK